MTFRELAKMINEMSDHEIDKKAIVAAEIETYRAQLEIDGLTINKYMTGHSTQEEIFLITK
jgi:hypothetical protein